MNKSFLLVFILAHLSGDFLLQTNKIARLKSSSFKGVIIHSGIVLFIQALFLGAFGLGGIIIGVLGGVIHFFIDLLKKSVTRFLKKQIIYFFIDQLLHFTVIFTLCAYFSKPFSELHINTIYLKAPITFIILGFVSNIAVKILQKDLGIDVISGEFFKQKERAMDGILCIILFCSMLLPVYFEFFITVILFYLYFIISNKKYMYNILTVIFKFSIYLVVAFLSFIFFK